MKIKIIDSSSFIPRFIEGTLFQWFENGDHPEDDSELMYDENGEPFYSEGKVVRRFRHPYVKGYEICKKCGRMMKDHGWIDEDEDGYVVCPGDFVIKS